MNGFSTVRVTFCGCRSSKELPRGLQLLDIGIFPCSDDQPKSGFTFAVLRFFSVFATLSKGSGHKFYSILERLTCPGFPGDLPNRSRELLATQRRFTYLLLLRRSGQAYPTATVLEGDDDLTIQCPACPNPGVNFDREEVNEAESAFMRFWLSYDGNFRNPRKAKKVDKDDFSYTEGNMYYVDQQNYQEWLREAGKQYGKCDNHKAAQGKYVKWGGLDVTGLGAFTCARHSLFLPRGLVDFYQGELFAYADYAFASVVLWLLRNGQLEFGMTYDIWCHWITKLSERLKNLPAELALPPDVIAQLTGGVPKFHLQGHAKVCWVRFSLNNMSSVGRIEGEGAERAWAYLNETSGSTSEKSPGARWDSINLIVMDWNFEKEIRMPAFLIGKFIEAKKMCIQQLGVFEELHQSLPVTLTAEWEKISTEPIEYARGKWTSPFEETERPAPGFQETIQRERAKEEEDTPNKKSGQSGVTKWISTAIEIEYSMELLKREAAKLGNNATPGQHNKINDKRKSLSDRVQSNRTKQASYMGDITSPNHPKRRIVSSRHPEYSELGLPTSYLASTLKEHSTHSLLELELELRRATCNDALRSVRHLLGAKALLLRYKRKHTSGERATTRAEKTMKDHQEKISRAQWRYNNSRGALLRHSAKESDPKTYLEMKNGDLRRLDDYLEESKGLGQGYESIAWIWRPANTPHEEAWQAEALKTEWFRARQRYRQWEEELKLVKREMVMTVRSYEHRASVWDRKSQANSLNNGMAEYAARRSDYFSRLAKGAASTCMEYINVSLCKAHSSLFNFPQGPGCELVVGFGVGGIPDNKDAAMICLIAYFLR
ncbi:hypothetical protein RSOL_068660 [Rhizoctonia solani AG-3 Rhs1AP]|uniref:CxC2-like cysteine cluster KDZ transposase-associated domain-containing protein n=1 Tax=Rhizoctonia solani AG-3 Rhs1AP TaxID=1086054 RepID=X8J0D6_9AGAM|nr:hypothetical protein RSOL_068660 [Rhizoctonia solani AG-3 Rhs1AP]